MRLANRVACLVVLATSTGEASAHGNVAGLGNFFSGVVHPLLEPAHLVSLIGFGLLIGPRMETGGAAAAKGFAVAALVAVAAVALGVTVDTDTALLAGAALAGLLTVIGKPLPRLTYLVLGVALGAGIGLGSRPDLLQRSAMIEMLMGSGLGASVWMINVVVAAQTLRRHWMQVLVRIFGSWVAACSILVLALVLSGRPVAGMSDATRPLGKDMPLDVKRSVY